MVPAEIIVIILAILFMVIIVDIILDKDLDDLFSSDKDEEPFHYQKPPEPQFNGKKSNQNHKPMQKPPVQQPKKADTSNEEKEATTTPTKVMSDADRKTDKPVVPEGVVVEEVKEQQKGNSIIFDLLDGKDVERRRTTHRQLNLQQQIKEATENLKKKN